MRSLRCKEHSSHLFTISTVALQPGSPSSPSSPGRFRIVTGRNMTTSSFKFIQAVKGRGCNRHFFCGVRSIFYAFEQHLSLNAIGGHFDQGRSSY